MGGIAEVSERLTQYRETLGMNLLVARPQLAGSTAVEREASMKLLLDEVMPRIE